MKKIISLAVIAFAACIPSWAVWFTGDHDTKLVAMEWDWDCIGPKGLLASDGSLVVTWLDRFIPTTYDLYMQIMDAEGTPLLGEDGVKLCHFKGVSYGPFRGYDEDGYSAILTADDNLLVSYAAEDAGGRLQVHTRMFSLKGEPLWEETEGVFPSIDEHYVKSAEEKPVVRSSGNSIYVGVMCHETTYGPKDPDDDDSYYFDDDEDDGEVLVAVGKKDLFKVMRYNPDGTQAWETPYESESKKGLIVAADEGGVLVFNHDLTDDLLAMRLDESGEPVWESPVIVGEDLFYDPYEKPKWNVHGLENGNYSIVYCKGEDPSSIAVNVLTPGGEMLRQTPAVCGSLGHRPFAFTNCLSKSYADDTAVVWIGQTNNNDSGLAINEFGADAGDAWSGDTENGFILTQNRTGVFGIAGASDGWIVYYGWEDKYYGIYTNHILQKVGRDGKASAGRRLLDDNTAVVISDMLCDGDCLYLILCPTDMIGNMDNTMNYLYGVQIMTVDISESTWGASAPQLQIEETAEPVYYNLQGMRLTTPAGVCIEKRGDKTRKLIAK